jgi:hypothetical protein
MGRIREICISRTYGTRRHVAQLILLAGRDL